MSERDEFDDMHTRLMDDAKIHPTYANNEESALYGYSEGAEHALDLMRIHGYRKPAPPTAEAIDAAAQAVYAMTQPSTSIAWELLPRIVQFEIREVALAAINATAAKV